MEGGGSEGKGCWLALPHNGRDVDFEQNDIDELKFYELIRINLAFVQTREERTKKQRKFRLDVTVSEQNENRNHKMITYSHQSFLILGHFKCTKARDFEPKWQFWPVFGL